MDSLTEQGSSRFRRNVECGVERTVRVDNRWHLGIDERWTGEDETVLSALDPKYIGATDADGPGITESFMESMIDNAIATHE